MANYTKRVNTIEIDGQPAREVLVGIPCLCGCGVPLEFLFVAPNPPKRVIALIGHDTVNLDPETFKEAVADILEELDAKVHY